LLLKKGSEFHSKNTVSLKTTPTHAIVLLQINTICLALLPLEWMEGSKDYGKLGKAVLKRING
jgi:uncharacterized membrane protein